MKVSTLKSASSRRGSALLIILAFVLLLTIIITAFLSKSMLEKTVSNASASQTRTDVFAAGAVDAILSDCQQEIAAGSKITTPTGTHVNIYSPATSKTIIPSRMASGSNANAIGFSYSSTLPNLLKCSTCGVPFYPTGDSTDFPLASTYPPSESTPSADSNDSTKMASLNGRLYSPARWNKPLLLPPTSAYTSSTYTDLTPNTSFVVPDWILVRRDGSNATTTSPWDPKLCVAAPTDVTTTNKNPVVGRYAYAIYDEGGLLDMNVAGYPSTAGPTNQTTHFYRSSLATVDLTTLAPSATGTAFFPTTGGKNPGNAIIDAIVGWRNYATLQTSGTIPTYSAPLAAVATNYFYNVQPPGSGFMHTTVPASVTSLATNTVTGQSDRKFSSRQQLINLMMNDIAQGNTTTQATMENALQYLGTFSRDLSQPSYQPDSGRPRMALSSTTVLNTNGQTVTDLAYTGSNAAATDDSTDNINVPFASTLVQAPFTRNDGSPANMGDPLVKKRFALNRLAWLTYAGCIATDAGTYNPTTGISNLVAALKTKYGYTDAFLLQGGPTNVQNYFGLTWAKDSQDDNSTQRSKWFYNVHNNSSGTKGMGIIRELGGPKGIAGSSDTSPHDPDFFELLKAAILTGSKGKTLTSLTGATYFQSNPAGGVDMTHPYNAQNNIDVSFDYQVLQIGANIIDQSRLDGYTTEIIFDNGASAPTANPFEVRGVENYPYLYRLRAGSLKLRNEHVNVGDPIDKTAAPTNQVKYPDTPTGFNDTGLVALMQIPEIWNPHDYNSPLGGVTGAPFPTSFRLIADSTTPTGLATQKTTTPTYATIDICGEDGTANTPTNNPSSSTALAAATGYYLGPPSNPVGAVNGGFAGEGISLNATNTALTFSVPSTASTLYREPTMLVRPNLPAGSNLATAWSSPPADWTSARDTSNNACYTAGQGFISEIPNPLSLKSPSAAESSTPTTQSYLGIVLGLYPVQFVVVPAGYPPTAPNCYIYYSQFATYNPSPKNYGITYRMQYLDPIQGGWVTYDEKYIMPQAGWVITPTAAATSGNLLPSGSASYGQSAAWQTFADPRTSRFGAPGGDNDNFAYDAAPGTIPYLNSPDYLDPANGVLVTDRPDYNQGFLFECFRVSKGIIVFSLSAAFAPGWPAANPSDSTTPNYNTYRWGPLTQNTLSTSPFNLHYSGDTAGSPGASQQFYYADPDGVVRRAMGGLVLNSSTAPTYYVGYPMTTATTGYKYPSGTNVTSYQSASRPYLLKRPYRSVGELGYVFSGTPWKNLDFSNPESGDSALLDVFCISDTDDPNGLVAGKVNLNTQQIPVLAAILSEAYYDDVGFNADNSAVGGYINSSDLISGTAYPTAAFSLATYLVNGPSGATGTAVTPLMNVRELVGKFVGSSGSTGNVPTSNPPVDGALPSNYAGFSHDIGTFYDPSAGAGASYINAYNTRFREAAVRALSAVGQTRVWNLMIDVVAQTGRYPSSATNASNFVVEGERRYWVHVAIDRYTGNILDRQIEEVKQ